MNNSEITKDIAELRSAVESALSRYCNDERAVLLKQALLSQIKTVELHFALMLLEKNTRFYLSLKDFDEIMTSYLRLNRGIRRLVTKAPKSLYETDPINGVYELLSYHFREEGER